MKFYNLLIGLIDIEYIKKVFALKGKVGEEATDCFNEILDSITEIR